MTSFDELVEAALAAPRRALSPSSIFAPFASFAWSPAPPQNPVGATAKEAHEVAWLLTCSPHLEQHEVERAADEVVYSAHLRRQLPVLEELYAKLASAGEGLVNFDVVEKALGTNWEEFDVGGDAPERRDPYRFQLVSDLVRESVREYILQLDADAARLPGCERAQTSYATEREMDGVRRATCHELYHALLDRETTTASLMERLTQLRDRWLGKHVAAAKERMRASLCQIKALSRVAAARDEELESELQESNSLLHELFADFPAQLHDQLQHRRVSAREVAQVFSGRRGGFVQAVTTHSCAVRATVLSRWLVGNSDAVAEACVSAIDMLSHALHKRMDAPEWCGIEFVLATSGPATKCIEWQPPAHLGSASVWVLAASSKHASYTGLRIARLFKALLDQARLGGFPARTARADALLPIVALFIAEGQVQHAKIVDSALRPVAASCEHAWPGDRERGATRQRCAPSAPSPPRPPTPHEPNPPPPRPPPVPQPPGVVPPELRRDHAILHGLALCLKPRQDATSVRVPLDEIVTAVRGVSPMLAAQSDASLRQATTWVAKEVIKRARAAANDPLLMVEFDSSRERSNRGRVGGIVCEGAGAAFLFEYVSWCVSQMRENGAAFAWHTSKSAKSKAAAVALKADKS
jgi:hypothetical protein